MKARVIILVLWVLLICCVAIGSVLPASSAMMAVVERLQVSDKVVHFCAYVVLALLPVIGFRDRKRGVVAGFSMFLLSLVLEAAQQFAPGRAVELHDIVANGAGVSCGVLLGVPIRACTAIV